MEAQHCPEATRLVQPPAIQHILLVPLGSICFPFLKQLSLDPRILVLAILVLLLILLRAAISFPHSIQMLQSIKCKDLLLVFKGRAFTVECTGRLHNPC